MRLLDFGWGPGTLTVGLAAAVHPGEVHGINIEESQIAIARCAPAAGGRGNATFHVGNVYELPFYDDYFDVAHCHAVLMHVPDTGAAQGEKSVETGRHHWQSGADCEIFVLRAGRRTHPGSLGHVRTAVDGQRRPPEMGKKLKRRLPEAGFVGLRAPGRSTTSALRTTLASFTLSS
jgi:SAM-dependent methyltransferase